MKNFKFIISSTALIFCLCPAISQAQGSKNSTNEEPISTGRPSFSGGTGTAGVGRVQFENGYTHTRANDGETIEDFPATLIRIGTGVNTELRLSVPNYQSASDSDSGFSDGSIAFRYRFYQSADGKNSASVTPALTLTAGNRRFGSPNVDPAVTFAFGRKLSSKANFSTNLILRAPSKFGGRTSSGSSGDGGGGSGSGAGSSGVSSQDTNNNRNFTVIPTALVSYSLTRKFGVFLDTYTILPSRGSSSSVVDTGVTYLINNDVQLDASTGFGVGGSAPDNFFGAGISFRF